MGDFNYHFFKTSSYSKQDLVNPWGVWSWPRWSMQLLDLSLVRVWVTFMSVILKECIAFPQWMSVCLIIFLSLYWDVTNNRRCKTSRVERNTPLLSIVILKGFTKTCLSKTSMRSHGMQLLSSSEIVEAWYDIFHSIVNKYAPLITRRIKRICQPKWITRNLKNEINQRDYLLKKGTENK